MEKTEHTDNKAIASTENIFMRNFASILLALFLVLAPQAAFANTGWDTGRVYEVYAYGSGNFLATIFNGIAMITSGGTIDSLVKIGLLLALMYGLMTSVSTFIGASGMGRAAAEDGRYKNEGFTTIISVALTALVAVGLFMSPRASVAIIDRVDPSQSQVVGNVPFPSAFIPHMMSTIGDGIGKEFEQVFSLPDALQFRNGGIALGAKYTDALMNIYPPNNSSKNLPADAFLITASLREYYVKCVFPNYASLDGTAGLKTASLDDLRTTGDLMTALKNSLYRDPHVVITSPNATGWATCAVAIDEIDGLWNNYLVDWRKDIEFKLSGNVGVSSISGPGNALNLGSGALTTAVTERYFRNSAVDSNTILKTIAAANLMRDSVDTYLAYMGSPTGNAMTAANRTTTSGWLTAAKFFNSLVHTTRAIVEGLIYGMSVLLPLFFVFGGLGALLFYGKISLWLQLWVPIYVLINLYADTEVVRVMDNIFLTATANSPSVETIDRMADQLELTLGYVGSLAPVVPAIAWGLVSGGAYAMTHAVQAVGGGSAPAAAASAGGQIAGMGNMSMGNMSMGNSNVNASTIASSQMGYMPGLMSSMTAGGGLIDHTKKAGGIENYINQARNAASTESINRVDNALGQLAQHDGNLTSLGAAAYAQGGGVMNKLMSDIKQSGGTAAYIKNQGIAGTQAAAALTGLSKAFGGDEQAMGNYLESVAKGDWTGQRAAAQKAMPFLGAKNEEEAAGRLVGMAREVTGAKTLGSGQVVQDPNGGYQNVAAAAKMTAMEHIANAQFNRSFGELNGIDMTQTANAAGFLLRMKSAQGASIGVNEENVVRLNEAIEKVGGQPVKVGETFTGKYNASNENLELSSGAIAGQGVNKTTKKGVEYNAGTDIFTGRRENSGIDVFTGKRFNNSYSRDDSFKVDTSFLLNDTHKELSYKQKESSDQQGGYQSIFYDPKTNSTVGGTQLNAITFTNTGEHGANRGVKVASTGEIVQQDDTLGKTRTINQDQTRVNQGTVVTGAGSQLAVSLGGGIGISRDNIDAAIVHYNSVKDTAGETASWMRAGKTVQEIPNVNIPNPF